MYPFIAPALFFYYGVVKKNDSITKDPNTVYVTGNTAGKAGAYSVATYWKNGTVFPLGNDTPSSASGITVVDTNVFVSGFSESATKRQFAGYWLNNVFHPVTDKACCLPSHATSIAVSGSNVYLGGEGPVYSTTGATIWKDGQPVTTTFNGASVVNSIFVAAADVHGAGELPNGVNSVKAVYWKNDQLQDLSPALPYDISHARGVSVKGTDVYIAGDETFDSSGARASYATYWKNGTPIHIGLSTACKLNAVFIGGNDIYFAGSTILNGRPVATYWKNGVATHITESMTSEARCIYVKGNDVYTAGLVSNGTGTAVYWKNHDMTYLSGNVAVGIFVN